MTIYLFKNSLIKLTLLMLVIPTFNFALKRLIFFIIKPNYKNLFNMHTLLSTLNAFKPLT
jgi:hypothetical protein